MCRNGDSRRILGRALKGPNRPGVLIGTMTPAAGLRRHRAKSCRNFDTLYIVLLGPCLLLMLHCRPCRISICCESAQHCLLPVEALKLIPIMQQCFPGETRRLDHRSMHPSERSGSYMNQSQGSTHVLAGQPARGTDNEPTSIACKYPLPFYWTASPGKGKHGETLDETQIRMEKAATRSEL